MKHRTLGSTGYAVSELGYGGWGLGGTQWRGIDDSQGGEAPREALNRGITFFDTALAYGDGHSERQIGQVLKPELRAGRVVVATKIPPDAFAFDVVSAARGATVRGCEALQERVLTMKEAPQEYIQRILSYVGGRDPLDIQARTSKELERLIAGASATRLRQRPAPGKWSIAEILAHLADVEIVTSWRIRAILGAPGTPYQAMDQDAWVTAGHYDKRDPRKSVEAFRVLREMNLALFKTLTPEQWKHQGIHAERGPETVEHIVRLYAGHDLNHIRQVERCVSAFSHLG